MFYRSYLKMRAMDESVSLSIKNFVYQLVKEKNKGDRVGLKIVPPASSETKMSQVPQNPD
jgi:hypothetical protein